jgi:hypothetical protein
MKSHRDKLMALHVVAAIVWVVSLLILLCHPFVLRELPWHPDNPLYWMFVVLTGIMFAGLPVFCLTTVTAGYILALVGFIRRAWK